MSGVIYSDSREQTAGHAAGLGHAAGIEGLMGYLDEGNVGWRQVQAVKRLRPYFFRSGSTQSKGNNEAEDGAERAIVIVWAGHLYFL